MEDNNNNIIVKGLAIILIAILGLNVYRTETTKKEMAKLATTVEQISAQLDSLGVVEAGAFCIIKAHRYGSIIHSIMWFSAQNFGI